MASYLNDCDIIDETEFTYPLKSYLPSEGNFKTERGVPDNEVLPVLTGADDIFSEIILPEQKDIAYQKASKFIEDFTRVFAKVKTQERAYSKFIQNKSELPDVELDWIFQYFRVLFLFSSSEDDYFCITKYNEKTKQYDSKTGPLEKEHYMEVAGEVMQAVG